MNHQLRECWSGKRREVRATQRQATVVMMIIIIFLVLQILLNRIRMLICSPCSFCRENVVKSGVRVIKRHYAFHIMRNLSVTPSPPPGLSTIMNISLAYSTTQSSFFLGKNNLGSFVPAPGRKLIFFNGLRSPWNGWIRKSYYFLMKMESDLLCFWLH